MAPAPPERRRSARASAVVRITAFAALLVALVLVGLIVLGTSSAYTLHIRFQDAGGLVGGNEVLMGPARVGTVNSVALSPDGGASVTVSLDSSAAPVREGTVARIYENSLSGLANKYIVLEPTSDVAPPIQSGGSIAPRDAYSPVNLDQLFDALNGPARNGLRGFIRGEAASIAGRARQGNQTLRYFAPALSSTAQVTGQLARDEAAFDGLLVQGAQTMQGLATRTQQLGNLVADTAATTGALLTRESLTWPKITAKGKGLTNSVGCLRGKRPFSVTFTATDGKKTVTGKTGC